MPIIHFDNFTNLDYSLDDLNDTTVSKLSGANISDSFLNTNNVYQYEYENLNSNHFFR